MIVGLGQFYNKFFITYLLIFPAPVACTPWALLDLTSPKISRKIHVTKTSYLA